MSQFFVNISEGNLPPQVATQYTADDATIAVPDANNLNVFTSSSVVNNDKGIQSTTDSADTVYYQLTNRLTGNDTTVDNTLTTLATLSLGATPGVYYISGNILGYDTTNIQGACFPFEFAARTDGATAIDIGSGFTNELEEPNFNYSLVQLQESGNDILVQVQGENATTINWNCILNYRFVS